MKPSVDGIFLRLTARVNLCPDTNPLKVCNTWIRREKQVPLERRNDALSKRSRPNTTGVDQSQYHLRDRITAIAANIDQLLSQEMPQLQHLEKFMEEISTAKMRQTSMITGDF